MTGPQAPTTDCREQMLELVTELYPICRSITGPGVEETLERMAHLVPLERVRTPSGRQVLDWTVPLEWHIREAYIEHPDGRRLVDFADHNLHVLNYSEGIDREVSHRELMAHLYTDERHPGWIPYRTSYYNRNWGFCTRHEDLSRFDADRYRARIDAEHVEGHLTYGELVLPGTSDREVLIFSHVCHPSLANDNLSGIAVTVFLARELARRDRRYTYRFVWAPGTIGSITWLANNVDRVDRIEHGLVAVLLGDQGGLTYKRSRRGDTEIDRAAAYLGRQVDLEVVDFEPYGYDERQLCSPGFDLPVGRLTRSPNGAYPEYHTSADDLSLVSADSLAGSLDFCLQLCNLLENNRTYRNLSPMGEPQLGRRGLYRASGGEGLPDREHAMLWLLNQSDGGKSLLDIATRSGVSFSSLSAVASELVAAQLLEPLEDTA